jgi:hypothetical protein
VAIARFVDIQVMVFGVLLTVVGASVLLTLNRTLWPPDARRTRPPGRQGPPPGSAADRQRKPGKPRKPGEVPRIAAPARSARSTASVRAGAGSARARNSPQVVPSGRANPTTYGELRGAGSAGPPAGRLRGAP